MRNFIKSTAITLALAAALAIFISTPIILLGVTAGVKALIIFCGAVAGLIAIHCFVVEVILYDNS